MSIRKALMALENLMWRQEKNISVHRMAPAECGHGSAVIVVHPCHCPDPRCPNKQAVRELNAWCERHLGEAAIRDR